MLMKLTLNINKREYALSIQPNRTLLWVLREELNLTGTKYGCGAGDCGACKVLVDGVVFNSCTLLARNMVGKKIVTIEGISRGDNLHPVQQAFIEAGAIQCGYCTPGMVISAVGLLNKNLTPNKSDIIQALQGNICRCTGYKKIIEAIFLAAEYMRGVKKKEDAKGELSWETYSG